MLCAADVCSNAPYGTSISATRVQKQKTETLHLVEVERSQKNPVMWHRIVAPSTAASCSGDMPSFKRSRAGNVTLGQSAASPEPTQLWSHPGHCRLLLCTKQGSILRDLTETPVVSAAELCSQTKPADTTSGVSFPQGRIRTPRASRTGA